VQAALLFLERQGLSIEMVSSIITDMVIYNTYELSIEPSGFNRELPQEVLYG
jgi:hypothetical protein